jgi:hypothetical protein
MWVIRNQTPYAVDRTWVQDKDANKLWLVAVKATFDILQDGSTRLSEEQEPPLKLGSHVGEPNQSSLLYEADLFGVKANTDVLVNGSAYSPNGRRVTSVDVELAVGPIRKRLRVSGERVWENALGGPSMSSPERFDSMPIRYERAFGGWDRVAEDPLEHRMDARNPIGTGFTTQPSHCLGSRAPNVEFPSELISSWSDRPQPAGFGPVECHWSPRRELAGTYDEKWRKSRFPLWAEDFDQRYNNCAPADQQVPGFLRGGETVELTNLSPSSRLVFPLPRVYPFFRTRFGQEQVEHRARLSTVIIEPDFPRVIMTWQTSLICNHRVDELDSTVVTEKRII